MKSFNRRAANGELGVRVQVSMCIPKSTISAYENDNVDIKGSVLVELSEHLDITPNYLLGVEEKEEDAFDMEMKILLRRITDDRVKAIKILCQMHRKVTQKYHR